MTSITNEPLASDPAPANPIAASPKPVGERFHQLDGLRAVACLIVVYHHSFNPIAKWFQSQGSPVLKYIGDLIHGTTGSGVELFFVLSGVVLLRPYVRGQRPFKAGTYFYRRIERLWPPYLVVLALESILTFIAAKFPTAISRVDRGYTFNLIDLGWQSLIINFGTPIWNMAWWSLSIEVMFYLVVPLVLPLFIWRGMTRPVLLILAIGLWALGIWSHPNPPVEVTWHLGFQFLAVYSLCFLVGIAIAKFDWRPREGWIFVGLGLGYLLTAMHFHQMNYHVGYALLYGGLVMLAFVRGSALQRLLSKHLMIWVGERSYSLFLIHFTIFFGVNYAISHFVPQKDATYFILSRGIGLPLALFAAMLLFHFVERRFARNLITANEFWPPLWSRTAREGKAVSGVSSM